MPDQHEERTMNTQNDATNNALSFWTVAEAQSGGGCLSEAVGTWGEVYRTKHDALQAVANALGALWDEDVAEWGNGDQCSRDEATHTRYEENEAGTRLVGYNEAYDRWFFVTKATLA